MSISDELLKPDGVVILPKGVTPGQHEPYLRSELLEELQAWKAKAKLLAEYAAWVERGSVPANARPDVGPVINLLRDAQAGLAKKDNMTEAYEIRRMLMELRTKMKMSNDEVFEGKFEELIT